MEKTRVAVVFGGVSSEHEISRLSASSVIHNLSSEKYELSLIGITKKGEWFLFSGDPSLIADGSWEQDRANRRCMISPDTSRRGIAVENGSFVPVDVIFPVLHGKNGEDGTIQGLFELCGIPFVGCGVLASSVCMDKAVTNLLLEQFGIAQAKFVWCYTDDYLENPEPVELEISEKLGFPAFVKPANAGSSVGISKVKKIEDLRAAMLLAAKEDSKLVIEEGIDGREVECAVLGNSKPIASVPGEILPANEFYDYEAKYYDDNSKLCIPAQLDEKTTDTLRTTAVKAFRLLGCSGLSRVDFFVRRSDNAVLLNELNTLPGFTSISMYPKLFNAVGIGYSELLDRLIALAIEKYGD